MKFSFFIPKQPIFFDLFLKLGQEVLNISDVLRALSVAGTPQNLSEFIKQAIDIEHRADEVTHQMVECLNKTFITPFDREDIYNLTEELDDIIDKVENVIHNLAIYGISPREKFLADFAAIIAKDAECLMKLVELLKQQKYTSQFRDYIIKIHDLEDQGDKLFLQTLKSLFQDHSEPVRIIKVKDVAEDLERVVDKFQTASNTFENILVKSQ